MKIVVWASGYGSFNGNGKPVEVAVNGKVRRLRLGEPADVSPAVVDVLVQGRYAVEVLAESEEEKE